MHTTFRKCQHPDVIFARLEVEEFVSVMAELLRNDESSRLAAGNASCVVREMVGERASELRLRDQIEFHSVRRFRMPPFVTFYSHVRHFTKWWTTWTIHSAGSTAGVRVNKYKIAFYFLGFSPRSSKFQQVFEDDGGNEIKTCAHSIAQRECASI
jgi:hypothetical protein